MFETISVYGALVIFGPHYLDHADLKLTDIFLPLPRSIGIKSMHNHDQLPREGFICLLDLAVVPRTSPFRLVVILLPLCPKH